MTPTVAELWRYPVKSMAGEALAAAELGRSGLAGDRRWAFVRPGQQRNGFPWLTIRERPVLHRYRPVLTEPGRPDRSPVRVLDPDGHEHDIADPALAAQLGDGVTVMKQNRGTFDAAPLTLITRQSVAAIGRRLGRDLEPRRFRANLVVDAPGDAEFPEDAWVGRTLRVGAAEIRVDEPDERCGLINVDPDTLARESDVLRTIAREHALCLGVYATVAGPGTVRVGDPVTSTP